MHPAGGVRAARGRIRSGGRAAATGEAAPEGTQAPLETAAGDAGGRVADSRSSGEQSLGVVVEDALLLLSGET